MQIVPNRGARLCVCELEKAALKKYERIPVHYRGLTLTALKADPKKHPKQAAALKALQDRPQGSYFFSGAVGTGKTTLLWALYADAVARKEPRIISCTLSQLLDEYRLMFNTEKQPRITAQELRTGPRHSIFLDDIDKARPTEYAGEQFFELTDAIYSHHHQLVTTSNLGSRDLIEHFNRANERYGAAIVRRLIDNSEVIEFN